MHFLTNFILYVYAVTNKRFELAMVLAMLVQILSDDGQGKSHNFQYFEKNFYWSQNGALCFRLGPETCMD